MDILSASAVKKKRKRVCFAEVHQEQPDATGLCKDESSCATVNNYSTMIAQIGHNDNTTMMDIDTGSPTNSCGDHDAQNKSESRLHASTKKRKIKDDELLQLDIIMSRRKTESSVQQQHSNGITSSTATATDVDDPNMRPSNERVPDNSDIDVAVHDTIRKFWGLRSDGVKYNPSPNPVSITRQDLMTLKNNEYVVSEKSDGVRYLLVLCRNRFSNEPIAVMMDRACRKYIIGIVANDKYFNGSIFDGELVLDQATHRYVFWVFDAVAVAGREVRLSPYNERCAIIRNCFDDPNDHKNTTRFNTTNEEEYEQYAKELAQGGKLVALDGTNHLYMRPKPCYLLSQVDILWHKIQSRKLLTHKNDGLIFTPVREPVGCRTHWSQFKWKQSHTIDFLLKLAYMNDRWYAALFFGDERKVQDAKVVPVLPLENAGSGIDYKGRIVKFTLQNNKRFQRIQQHMLANRVYSLAFVVECSADFAPNSDNNELLCSIERIRTDKTVPNTYYTVMKTIENIEENIEILEIVQVTDPSATHDTLLTRMLQAHSLVDCELPKETSLSTYSILNSGTSAFNSDGDCERTKNYLQQDGDDSMAIEATY